MNQTKDTAKSDLTLRSLIEMNCHTLAETAIKGIKKPPAKAGGTTI